MAINEPRRADGPIHLAEPDASWPAVFEEEAARLRAALGAQALLVEHVGSTSVPGLAAKPIIDIILVVADSADEPSYLPAMEVAGYELRIREPAWYEHRLFNGPGADVHVHVYSEGCEEIDRMIAFRDRLRASEADRALYERTKRALAARHWRYVQSYADAKSEVVRSILERAAGG